MWVDTRGRQVPGQIVQPANTPTSYMVDVPSGQIHGNHKDLQVRIENRLVPSQKLDQELLLHVLAQE